MEVAILGAASAIYFIAYFHRVAIPGTIFDELQTAFHASAGAVACLGAIYLYIYGGMQFFAGMMNDRFGALRVLLLGALLLCLGSLTFPLSNSLPLLYASRALVGLGSSLIFISLVKALDMLFPPAFFTPLLGIVMFIGCAGGLVGTAPFDAAVSAWHWRPVLLGVGVLCALACVVYLLLFRAARRVATVVATAPLMPGVVLRNRLSLPLLIAGSLNFAIYFLLQATIGKKFLLDYAHVSSAMAASFTFIMMLVSMTAVLLGGLLPKFIGDRRKPVYLFALGCTLLGTILLLIFLHAGVTGPWLLICFMLLATSSLSSPVGNALMRELNPPEATGTSLGLLNGASYLSVAGLSTGAGLIMDHFRTQAVTTATAVIYPREAYLVIFVLCLTLSIIAFTGACFLYESQGKYVYGQEHLHTSPK